MNVDFQGENNNNKSADAIDIETIPSVGNNISAVVMVLTSLWFLYHFCSYFGCEKEFHNGYNSSSMVQYRFRPLHLCRTRVTVDCVYCHDFSYPCIFVNMCRRLL